MSALEDDPIVSVLPIRFSDALSPNIHLHQYPLLTRSLQVPPAAAKSGKKIRARLKPKSARLEVHVPTDTRTEVWNKERGEELGQARLTDDAEKNAQSTKGTNDPRLTEVRLRSEKIEKRGAYMLGIVRDGQLHLHPISETHQMRPALTYMDVYLRKSRRSRSGADSDSDSDEVPPDPDDPNPPPPTPKKEPKIASGEAKEVNVSIRKADDKGAQSFTGGLSAARREMLHILREEEDEAWEDYDYYDAETEEATEAFESVFSKSETVLQSKTDPTAFLSNIPGL